MMRLALIALFVLSTACSDDPVVSDTDTSGGEVTPDTTDTTDTPDTTDTDTDDTVPDTDTSGDTTPDTDLVDTLPDSVEPPDGEVSETSDTRDVEPDAPPTSCLVEHEPGDRFPAGDHCNSCECQPDGSTSCTARKCANQRPGCDYDGVEYGYGERFPATDRCNECVCAASGLACTRRCSGVEDEGAILMEDMDEPCGETLAFTARNVLAEIPTTDVTGAFVYNRSGPLYPETRADTSGRLRIVYEGGFIVCRLPSIEQPAFDIEVAVEWSTGDGAFDEGMHTYLRKNGFGFVDAWHTLGTWRHGNLDGTYQSDCLDPSGYSFSAQIDRDGTVDAHMYKTCETDIGLTIGSMQLDVTP